MSNKQRKILLKTDTKTITLELGRREKSQQKQGDAARGLSTGRAVAWRMGTGAR
jgi:hypothetical protein